MAKSRGRNGGAAVEEAPDEVEEQPQFDEWAQLQEEEKKLQERKAAIRDKALSDIRSRIEQFNNSFGTSWELTEGEELFPSPSKMKRPRNEKPKNERVCPICSAALGREVRGHDARLHRGGKPAFTEEQLATLDK